MLYLNLGSGALKIPGFIGVDLCEGSDLKHDLKEPLPYKDGEVDTIMAIHVIESFYQWEFPAILKDWRRVLRPGGTMTIEFTDLESSAHLYLKGIDEDNGTIKDWGRWGFHGNQAAPLDPIVLHHYVYEVAELTGLLYECGFHSVNITKEGIKHCPERDYRAVCF